MIIDIRKTIKELNIKKEENIRVEVFPGKNYLTGTFLDIDDKNLYIDWIDEDDDKAELEILLDNILSLDRYSSLNC